MISSCKSLLNDQQHRIQAKHAAELELIDDLRAFLKAKADIERKYGESLVKLCSSRASSSFKKYPTFADEADNDVKSVYSAWRKYIEDVEASAKARVAQYEQFYNILDSLKTIRTHKSHNAKKGIDTHLK